MATRKPGRPPENHEKLTCYVTPQTITRIRALKTPKHNTLGKVIDHRFKKRGVAA